MDTVPSAKTVSLSRLAARRNPLSDSIQELLSTVETVSPEPPVYLVHVLHLPSTSTNFPLSLVWYL